ncbi:hypothetical protein [Thalassotalea mangrovi]|uniref:Uncharacterized protein n=1 Tax=Thalassotalea mangrovi TaxID=2572245 RepID=A0A4U1B7R3_9GAMM|nr:hypothetical protein [Thalassotalea mangrovi]TKB46282.1 hypothetical protein E8M12_04310 [Thalassotalea mangrovi]
MMNKRMMVMAGLWLSLTNAMANPMTEGEEAILIKQAFPAMKFISTVDDNINFDLLIKDPLLVNLEKDLHGSPFLLASFVENHATQGGQVSQFTTGLLSASTLGLVPVVSNNDLTIYYRIRLQKNTISEFSYSKNFTDAGFLWAGPNQELTDEAKAWVESTVPMFLQDLRKDKKLKAMIDEYEYYFGGES